MTIPNDFQQLVESVRRALLAARNSQGHWEGTLSSSALSTATASFALHLYLTASPADAGRCQPLRDSGLRWLIDHQNPDGGWGDTVDSVSNISTTALCWAALAAVPPEFAAPAVARAETWLARAAGSIEPAVLARAITARYGKDRTFSVPILTMCALAGRLGAGADAWRFVTPLPFELSVLPHRLFKFVRLPVVSYALPALIAMGQVRHHRRPSRNPLARLLRNRSIARSLGVLESVQPAGGGFLEATPLTSFVVMSLLGCGLASHPVVRNGIDFLIRSARPDGSWPIDTNLATWVTTLSINALAAAPGFETILGPEDRRGLRDWLIGQQYLTEHPYTRAAPGGWAWTDLPGGVPDADDTAGALVALKHLDDRADRTLDAAAAGVRWLLDLQNSDGGMPTFCRGWGNLPFDRSGPDLTAHAILAWSAWVDALDPALAGRTQSAADRALTYLINTQRPDGAWTPLWFGNQSAPGDENPTYGTSRVLPALAVAARSDDRAATPLARGTDWLLSAQSPQGGWGGARGVSPSVEETSLAMYALASTDSAPRTDEALMRGVRWLADHAADPSALRPTPIGLYFAKLWYSERLYPLIFAAAATGQIASQFPQFRMSQYLDRWPKAAR